MRWAGYICNSLNWFFFIHFAFPCLVITRTVYSDKDNEGLFREGLDCADVPSLVHLVHIHDHQHPVVEVLVHDGVAGVPSQDHVPHREKLHGGLPCHCPGHQGSLGPTIMLGKIYQQWFNLFISDSILLSFMHFGKKRFPSSHSLQSCSSIM